VPLVGGLCWWWRTVPANRGAAVAVASLFLYVLSGEDARFLCRTENRNSDGESDKESNAKSFLYGDSL
jgi:hypothetical protein